MARRLWGLLLSVRQLRVDQLYVSDTLESAQSWNTKQFVRSGIGVFQDYYQTGPLSNFSPSTVAWIPSLQTFMMFLGVNNRSSCLFYNYPTDHASGPDLWQSLRQLRTSLSPPRWHLFPRLWSHDDLDQHQILPVHPRPGYLLPDWCVCCLLSGHVHCFDLVLSTSCLGLWYHGIRLVSRRGDLSNSRDTAHP